ncbi:helix-turn-helix transcriptional regulator [Mucilaginibacter sp. UR6-1]|uniref:helix-turn-helix domain-containing protein n=1 Tax=Mucilaginibacter sp. UR6-1 TaxID=1435643 RepID=UPI001E605ABF|nr:helix-turn-helix transcriptional regulator [Mucilaginibacter sp. UR6-1]MCC8408299.1 helix-turn-helix transcriptional regulator [Mucilaginibacter sp. UR6-1]
MHSKTKMVAANIRRLREARNYSQDYVAMKVNISQNAYSKIELGYSKISLDRLFLIADALEVDYTQLIEPSSDNRMLA